MGVIAVREMARHRYRQSQFAGLTRLHLDEVGRERQVQQQGRQRAEALAERSVEIAQAMVPLAGGCARALGWLRGCGGRCVCVCVRVNVRCVWVAFVCRCFACDCVLELVLCRVRLVEIWTESCLACIRSQSDDRPYCTS